MSQVSKQQAYRSNWSSYTPGHNTLVPSLHKLFSERIEFFSSVEFSKVSILTGIIKISLKVSLWAYPIINAFFVLASSIPEGNYFMD